MAESLTLRVHKDPGLQGCHCPTLLFDAETWVLPLKQIRLLEWFDQCCLRSNLGIKWLDHVLNKEVLKRASLPSIDSTLLRVQLHWAGHVTRMEAIHIKDLHACTDIRERDREREKEKGQAEKRCPVRLSMTKQTKS